jgi:hypothetical protein
MRQTTHDSGWFDSAHWPAVRLSGTAVVDTRRNMRTWWTDQQFLLWIRVEQIAQQVWVHWYSFGICCQCSYAMLQKRSPL